MNQLSESIVTASAAGSSQHSDRAIAFVTTWKEECDRVAPTSRFAPKNHLRFPEL
ncbi:MAG: hypothetical protein AB1861_22045 [Cyanobacteriota bacterium]